MTFAVDMLVELVVGIVVVWHFEQKFEDGESGGGNHAAFWECGPPHCYSVCIYQTNNKK